MNSNQSHLDLQQPVVISAPIRVCGCKGAGLAKKKYLNIITTWAEPAGIWVVVSLARNRVRFGYRPFMQAFMHRVSVLAVLLAIVGFSSSSVAALGGDAASVEADRVVAKASSRAIDHDNYTVYELQISPEASIKEYLAGGVVFAVSWDGPALPDLRQLLGSYFDEYRTAAQAQRTNHRSLIVQTADLVVASTGRMGAFSGRAYLPQRLPAGVATNDIR